MFSVELHFSFDTDFAFPDSKEKLGQVVSSKNLVYSRSLRLCAPRTVPRCRVAHFVLCALPVPSLPLLSLALCRALGHVQLGVPLLQRQLGVSELVEPHCDRIASFFGFQDLPTRSVADKQRACVAGYFLSRSRCGGCDPMGRRPAASALGGLGKLRSLAVAGALQHFRSFLTRAFSQLN